MKKLTAFQDLIEEGLRALPLSGKPVELFEPMRYVLALGGKRMRPLLTLIACDLFDGVPAEALGPALGIELFHNFSLVHDDIMDKAPLRRNNPTIHEKWNPNTAILSGDAMLILAYQQIAKAPPEKLSAVLEIFNHTALLVCEGQQLDMNFEKTFQVSIRQYLGMIELKTAVLLAGSLKTGAVLGKASAEDAERIYQFGKNMGIAFQLQDDILDVYGDSDKFGKQKGGDILSNKKTFLLLKAFELAKNMPYKYEELMQWIHAPEFKPQDKVEAVTGIYDCFNIRSLAHAEMEKYYNKALSMLDEIPADPEKKEMLRSLTGSLMVREV
jgi:geranylgeranyl diphosphate synthase type II